MSPKRPDPVRSPGRRAAIGGLAAGALALRGGPALAQGDASTVTLLVGAASAMDSAARQLGDLLREQLNRPVVVVSKLGAGGRLALGDLKRAAPDGRTLMLSTSSPFTIFPNIYTRLEYDPVADFTPIANVAWFDIGISVGPAVPVSTMAQLVEWMKAQRGEVIYGMAPGTGSASHFAGIATALATGLKLVPVPYKDSAQGIADAIGGRLPIMVTGTSPLVQMHKAGRLRLLATTGEARSPLVPDVPTLKESGIDAGISVNASLYGPAGLPTELVARLHAAVQPIFTRPEQRERLVQQGMAPSPMTPQQLVAALAEERKRFEHLAKASGYVPEPA